MNAVSIHLWLQCFVTSVKYPQCSLYKISVCYLWCWLYVAFYFILLGLYSVSLLREQSLHLTLVYFGQVWAYYSDALFADFFSQCFICIILTIMYSIDYFYFLYNPVHVYDVVNFFWIFVLIFGYLSLSFRSSSSTFSSFLFNYYTFFW